MLESITEVNEQEVIVEEVEEYEEVETEFESGPIVRRLNGSPEIVFEDDNLVETDAIVSEAQVDYQETVENMDVDWTAMDCSVEVACPFCSEYSGTWTPDFDEHLRSHWDSEEATRSQYYMCPKCGLHFESEDSILRHAYSYVDVVFPCNHCPVLFEYPGDLLQHTRSHLVIKEEGEEGDDVDRGEEEGQRTQDDEEAYSDGVIDLKQEFLNPDGKKKRRPRSQKSKTGTRDPMECDLCGKVLRDRTSQERHRLRHITSKSHKCHLCDSSFVFANDLEVHIRFHNPDNHIHVCNICDPPKKYFFKRSLNAHVQRNHNSERARNIPCPDCEKMFYDQSALKKHSFTHGERAFECDLCNGRFARPDHLKIHMRTHSKVPSTNSRFKTES